MLGRKTEPEHAQAPCPECGRKDGFVVVRQECSADPAKLAVRVERVVLVCQGDGRGQHAIEMTRSGLTLHKAPLAPPSRDDVDAERKRRAKNGEPEEIDTDLPGIFDRRRR